jgi:hypothetical protein
MSNFSFADELYRKGNRHGCKYEKQIIADLLMALPDL